LKKKGFLTSKWKKRFFREADVVVFFSKLQDEAATDRIWLDQISSVTPVRDPGKFNVTLHDGTLFEFDAGSSTYKEIWMRIFNKRLTRTTSFAKIEVSRCSSLNSLQDSNHSTKSQNNTTLSSSSEESQTAASRTQHGSFSNDNYNTIPTSEPIQYDTHTYDKIPSVIFPATKVIYNNIPNEPPAPDSPQYIPKRNHERIPSQLD